VWCDPANYLSVGKVVLFAAGPKRRLDYCHFWDAIGSSTKKNRMFNTASKKNYSQEGREGGWNRQANWKKDEGEAEEAEEAEEEKRRRRM